MRKNVVWVCVLILILASCASTSSGESGGRAGAAAATNASRTDQIPVATMEKVLFADGSLDEFVTSEYDDSLSLVQNQNRYSASGALLEQVEYSYQEGSDRLTTKITRDTENRLKSRTVYQYNDQGGLQKETLVNKAGKAVSSYEYAYNERGHRTRRILSSGADIKMAETLYTVDNNGVVSASETRDATGRRISSIQNQYDNRNNLIQQTILDANGQVSATMNYVWQGTNEISSEQKGSDGSVQIRVTNEYGNSGELLKRTIENLQGNSVQIMEYEYAFKPARR